MSRRPLLQVAAALLLLAAGTLLVLRSSPPEHKEMFLSEGCALSVHLFEPHEQPALGSVLLFHGLAGTEKVMDYYTRGFLALGLRVVVPDLPGHGASPGPFSASRAEACSEALFTALVRRGEIVPARTLLAGHSLGGAIALRLGARNAVAGVVALSPAPMLAAPGVSPEVLFYPPPMKLPPHSLLVSGAFEPVALLRSSELLFVQRAGLFSEIRVVPAASHVSLLLDAAALRLSLDWTSRVLALPALAALPDRSNFLGFLLGLCGLALLSGTLLRAALPSFPRAPAPKVSASPAPARGILEMAAASFFAVGLLKFGVPLRFLGLCNGDYLASFLLLVGLALLLLHARRFRPLLRLPLPIAARAAALACALCLLFFAWFHFTITSAWLDAARLWRFPLLILALFPFFAAEEYLLGPVVASTQALRLRRLAHGLAARLAAWLPLYLALFYLHNAQVLLVLLAPYFALFSALQRWGVDRFEEQTRCPAGAALFGAILATVFGLLLFPLT